MNRITSVTPGPDYGLTITFDDGLEGTINLRDQLYGPMFEPLKDMEIFKKVTLDDFGAPCWPNGADIAPDALYSEIKSMTEQSSR